MKESKKKILIVSVIAAVVVIFVAAFSVYKVKSAASTAKAGQEEVKEEIKEELKEEKEPEEEKEEEVYEEISFNASGRPSIMSEKVSMKLLNVTPSTKPYNVEPDLSNIDNKELYYFDEKQTKLLCDNYFYVTKPYGDYEFFEVYETNRYFYESNFVTVDSLMHTYHLYFSHLLKNLEKNQLADALSEMDKKLLAECIESYEKLKGTQWEDAAKRNVAFVSIASALQGNNDIPDEFKNTVDSEVKKINDAGDILVCEITDSEEDYTQYKPRGYYEGDEVLEQYFKTMMWLGRINFNTKSDDMVKSSILMNVALNNSAVSEWKNIYDITSFFAGTNDDLGYYEYMPLIDKIYGENADVTDIADNEEAFDNFKKEVKGLSLPKINSIPIKMGQDNVIQSYRVMGQRFTIDAAIMQQLVYSATDKNSDDELRMLPDVLDVAAALGSDTAYDLLKEQGDTGYKNYTENMDKMREEFSTDDASEYLSTSLYGNWLNTLRPLLKEKGEGYPSFMQSTAWAKKDLETFAGSFTELKHDTILYSKQVMAEMGSGDIPEPDDRGYVQPEPEVYTRFSYLANATGEGLNERGLINSEDLSSLKKLAELADKLAVISEKELRDETLTDEEYDLIREYGGTLEHFWYDATKAMTGDDEINTEKYQASLVVDVATDPNGQVLEMATGKPCTIYVVVNVDGKIKIAKGSVYSFYQFAWPMNDRLTDSKWRQMMSFEPGEDGFYSMDEKMPVEPVWWTKDYSYIYEW